MSSVNTYKFFFHFVLSLHLINIALPFVFKMSGFDTSLKACTRQYANGSIDDQLIKLLPGMHDPLTQVFNVRYISIRDIMSLIEMYLIQFFTEYRVLSRFFTGSGYRVFNKLEKVEEK